MPAPGPDRRRRTGGRPGGRPAGRPGSRRTSREGGSTDRPEWGGVARRGAGRMHDDVRGGSARRDAGSGSRPGPEPRRSDNGGAPARRNPPELSPPPPHEPEVWVREDAVGPAPTKRRRDRPAPIDTELVESELVAVLGPAKGKRAAGRVAQAATAFANERLDEARKILSPIATEAPRAASVRELLGLVLYQLGRWRPAARELEAFGELTGGVDQHPVLADCYRAVGRHADAEALWEELRDASPSADLVAEGRIVAAGSLADRGRLADAIRLLESAPRGRKARQHHLRTAYVLADLRERAGDVSRSRELFAWIAGVDPDFADVTQRLAALS